MDVQFEFPDSKLSTEHQALVNTLNDFLAVLPEDEYQQAAVRLCMELLELADVATQEDIARAAGYAERTLRFYKQRVQDEGLGGLLDHPIPGRPSITAQPSVEGAVVQALLEATQKALVEGIAAARAGRPLGAISYAIESVAKRAGLAVVREYGGHGIGQKMHEPPNVPNWGPAHRGIRLLAGMTLALEPMLTLCAAKTRVLDDRWTVVTADGCPAAHFEHTIVITEDGAEILTRLPEE